MKKLYESILLILFTVFVFVAEQYYREPLYAYSIKTAIPLTQYYLIHETLELFIYGNFMGSTEVTLILLMLVFIIFPLHKSYVVLVSYCFSFVFPTALQPIYAHPLPYYDNNEITPYICMGGFGNPNANISRAVTFYLSLLNITLSTFPSISQSNFFYVTTTFFTYSLITFISYSYIVLGLAALNQILFAVTLGLTFYLLFFKLIHIINENGEYFYWYITDFKVQLSSWLKVAIVAFKVIFLYYHSNFQRSTLDAWNIAIQSKCPLLDDNHKFKNDYLNNAVIICILIGGHFGFNLVYWFAEDRLECLIKENEEYTENFNKELYVAEYWEKMNNWQLFTVFNFLKRLLVSFTFISFSFSTTFFVKDNQSNYLVYVFLRFIIPYTLSMFSLVFVCIHIFTDFNLIQIFSIKWFKERVKKRSKEIDILDQDIKERLLKRHEDKLKEKIEEGEVLDV